MKKNLTEKQQKGRDFKRSLYIVQDVNEGDILTEDNVRSIRPGFGLHPKFLKSILKKKITKKLESGSRLLIDDIDFK